MLASLGCKSMWRYDMYSTRIFHRRDRLSACGPAQAGRDRRENPSTSLLTAEVAENAEKCILVYLCALCALRGERSLTAESAEKSISICLCDLCGENSFLCGLRLPVPARQTGGLCGKTETFGLNPPPTWPWLLSRRSVVPPRSGQTFRTNSRLDNRPSCAQTAIPIYGTRGSQQRGGKRRD